MAKGIILSSHMERFLRNNRQEQTRHDAVMMQMVTMAAHVAHNVMRELPEHSGRSTVAAWEDLAEEDKSLAVGEVLTEMRLMAEDLAPDDMRSMIIRSSVGGSCRAVISGMMARKEDGND